MENAKRVSFDSPHSWELGGESIIHCELIPDLPREGEEMRVRLTHTNGYGPGPIQSGVISDWRVKAR